MQTKKIILHIIKKETTIPNLKEFMMNNKSHFPNTIPINLGELKTY